jgi:Mrp family chromosome partitioning ATPase
MSDVLQLSDAAAWTAVETGTSRERAPVSPFAPIGSTDPEPHSAGASPTPAATVQAMDSSPTTPLVSVADQLSRLRSGATPYLQYLTRLVQRLFLTTDRLGGEIRSVAFSAVDTRDDSALLAAAAAELLASRVTGRVCIVDADIYSPSLHSCYGVSNEIGLIDALSNRGPIRSYARRLVQGSEASLWLLPSGSSGFRELLLTSAEVEARTADMLAAFDYVVIAAPSVTQYPEVAALGAQVDGVVMIADAQVTRRRAVRACADAFCASGGRVLGTVLSNRRFPIPEAVYRLL